MEVRAKTVARVGGEAKDGVKFKLAYKHRILILKPLPLQLVIAIKETTRSIIFPSK